MSFSPYAIPGLVSALLVIATLPGIWRHRSSPGAQAFLGMNLLLALWAGLQAAAALVDSFEAKYLIARLQYTPISFTAYALFLFAARYGGRSSLLRRPVALSLAVIPAISSLLALTNPRHSLLWTEVRFFDSHLPIQTPAYGSWFFVHMPYGYALILSSIVLIALTYRRSHHQRGQTLLLVAAPTIVIIVNILYLTRRTPLQPLDPTPTAFAIATLLAGLALYRYRLFDLVPIARRAIVDQLPDAVVVLDRLDRIVELNPSAARLLDLDSRGAIGASASEALPERLAALLRTNTGPGSAELRLGEADAERTYDVRLRPLERGGELAGQLLVVQDVTERTREAERLKRLEQELRQANASLERVARIDGLTGLARRHRFLQRLDEEFSRSRRYKMSLSLLILDVDHFKAVNDSYGHSVGDRVLAEIAHALDAEKRQTDFSGRLGGEEFGLLITHTDGTGALDVANRVCSRIAELRHQSPDGGELIVTASIGVATTDEQGETAQDLLDRADKALYRAKAEGRHRVIVATARGE